MAYRIGQHTITLSPPNGATVIGGLIMPTVLIGIVCISFEESEERLKQVRRLDCSFALKEARAHEHTLTLT